MGYSLVLGIVIDSLCVADGARFLFPEFLSHCSLLVKLPHNFFSCNSNECPPPQLLRKGRIYCCWTCTQTDHKFGRCFLFLAHWGFYWLPSFFSLYFFFPWKSGLDGVRGEMLTLGIQKFLSHHLLVSWRTESWKDWSSGWCWKEEVLWRDTKSYSNYAIGVELFCPVKFSKKIW